MSYVDQDYDRLIQQEYDYRDHISTALWEEKYVEYAPGDTPLTISELPTDLRESSAFKEFQRTFGWPDITDGAIEPLAAEEYEFDSAATKEFIDRFYPVNPSDPTSLSNFRLWITSEPHEQAYSPNDGIEQMYGAHPALHRLYVLMPEVMASLRMLLNDMESRHQGDCTALRAELGVGANEEIVKAIMIVHQVAGRLLKTDDLRRQQRILFPDRPITAPDITDAHTALRT